MFALRCVIAYNRPMRTTSYSDLRRNLAATLDSVSADHEPVVITRDRGKPAAVLMSLEISRPMKRRAICSKARAMPSGCWTRIQSLDAGKGTERELSE